MTGIAATSHPISKIRGRRVVRHDARTLRLTAVYVAAASALIAALLAASVALTPLSPTPDQMRLLEPAPGGAAAAQASSAL